MGCGAKNIRDTRTPYVSLPSRFNSVVNWAYEGAVEGSGLTKAILQSGPFKQRSTFMNKTSTLIFSGLLAAFTVSGFAQTAAAPTAAASRAQWKKDHPRRAEVNARLANQNKRINDKVADGKMSPAKAAKLHKEDKQIRQEERDMAAQNGGHITKQEQAVLNKQENKVSNQIGK